MNIFTSGLLNLLLFLAPADKQLLKGFTEQAQKEHKYIAVYFSGSDWCNYCHYFNSHILQQAAVQELLHNNYIYYNADFPQRKKLSPDEKQLNDAWAETLNPEGTFPILFICDEEFQIKSRLTRSHTPAAVSDTLKKYSNR